MKSTGPSPPVTLRTASAKRSSQVGSRPLPEREVGGEPARSSSAARSSRPIDHQDRRRLARDEVHQPAHGVVAAIDSA